MKHVLAIVFLFSVSVTPTDADWLSFRGNNGVATGTAPKQVDEDSIVWAADVPGRGVSSPIVVGDQIIVTASSGILEDRLHVVSFDTATGDLRWHRQFWATGRTLCHPTSANAAPTPASDGESIVAFFSSSDCVCLGLDGELKWFRGLGSDYPKLGNDVGMASSPMIAAGVVVCQAESQGDSFVEGLDAKDGTTLWRLERPKVANWTSPVHLPGDLTDMVLLKCEANVSAHDLQTGDMVWKIDAEVGGIPCMAVTNDRIYVPGSTFLALDRSEDAATVDWD
jgi:outer membrane protein assembly factor BamB